MGIFFTDAVAMVNGIITVQKALKLVRGDRSNSNQLFYHKTRALHLWRNQIKFVEHTT